jgi:chloride channel 7
VCSHWSAKLTWRSFFCVTIGAFTFNTIINESSATDSDGVLISEGFVIGLKSSESRVYHYHDFYWLALIGIAGGVIGALYTKIVLKCNSVRQRFLAQRPHAKVLDALFWSLLAFIVFFYAPLAFSCEPCPAGSNCAAGSSDGSHGRRLAGGGGLSYVQHACRQHEYNELATLLTSPQEGLLKHLLERSTDGPDISIHAVGWMLLIYFIVAVLIFGIAVPAGNFIPAMTIGAALGRLIGMALGSAGLIDGDEGRYALCGAGAVLCGVTRMTLTLAAILVEITMDVDAILPLMFTLAISKIVADFISPGFDDGMIHLRHLPFLEEEPPHEFELLTARDVMGRNVVVLKEVELVGDVLAVLQRTRHSGFPVVDVGRNQKCTFFAGLIQRQQLLVLLHERVWTARQGKLPLEMQEAFYSSPMTKLTVEQLKLSDDDLVARLDLRAFMDPCPTLANELTPLRRVYWFFNQLGVRHLVVVDCREQARACSPTHPPEPPPTASCRLAHLTATFWARWSACSPARTCCRRPSRSESWPRTARS